MASRPPADPAGAGAGPRYRLLARQVASFGGGRLVASLVSAVWMVVAARELTLDQLGDFSVLLSVGAIFAILSDLGWPLLLTDAVARAGTVGRRTLVHVIRRRLVAGCVATVVTGAFYLGVASDRSLVPVLLFGMSLVATAFHSSITAVLRGLGRYGVDAACDIGTRIVVLGLGALWLVNGGGLAAAIAGYALADVVAALVIGGLAWRWITPWDDTIDHGAFGVKRSLPLSGGRLLDSLYYRIDLWLVALLAGSAEAGRYAAPYRILDGLQLLPRALGMVALAHAGVGEREGRRPLSAARLAMFGGGATTLIAVPIALLAEPVLRVTFGPQMASAAPVLAVLMVATIPGAVVMALLPRVAVLSSRRFARSMAVALAVNVALNLVMIPWFGPVGAAWTTLFCQTGLAAQLLRIERGRERVPAPLPPAAEVAALR